MRASQPAAAKQGLLGASAFADCRTTHTIAAQRNIAQQRRQAAQVASNAARDRRFDTGLFLRAAEACIYER